MCWKSASLCVLPINADDDDINCVSCCHHVFQLDRTKTYCAHHLSLFLAMNNRIHTLGSLKANKSSSSTVTTTDVASRSADVPRQATTSAADIETEVVSLIDYTSNLLRAGQGVSVATASLSRRFEAFLNENYKPLSPMLQSLS